MLTAAITAVVTWIVTPTVSPREAAQTVWGAGLDLVQDDPPPPPAREWIVDAYMEETRTAAFWAKPPTMIPPAASLMRDHFAEFDPRRSHSYRKTRFKLWIPELIRMAPLFAGQRVEVLGRVVNFNLLGSASPTEAEWIVQLAPVTSNDGLV